MALFKTAMSYCHAYQEYEYEHAHSNMKPTMENAAKVVAYKTGFDWNEDDIAECCEQIMGS